jgi:hypothetical protein
VHFLIYRRGDWFFPNALLIFKSGMKSGDYNDEMNAGNLTRYTYM